MFREIISMMPGNEVIAIASMFFFILMFLGVVVWVVRADRSYLDHMKRLPLEKMNNNDEANDG